MHQVTLSFKVLAHRLIAFGIYLILLLLTNILVPFIPNEDFYLIVKFLNSNLNIVIIFSILFIIAEMFDVLEFPLNLPSPVFNGIGAIVLVKFMFLLLRTILIMVDVAIEDVPLQLFYAVTSGIVFLMIVIAGYANIFSKIARRKSKRKFHNQPNYLI